MTPPNAPNWINLEELATKLSNGVTDPAAITDNLVRASLCGYSKAALIDLAVISLGNVARMKVRVRVLEAEREATSQRATRQAQQAATAATAQLYQGHYRHGSMNKKDGAVPRGCECQDCTDVRQIEERATADRQADMRALLNAYAKACRMEWTADLLALSFAVDNSGATVTWGGATVEQHQTRVEMLSANAIANAEAAARHQAAIEDITSTPGAACLSDVVKPSAQAFISAAKPHTGRRAHAGPPKAVTSK
jgi:hypothetical protein